MEASHDTNGDEKPSMVIPNRNAEFFWLCHDLGIEGYNDTLTQRMLRQDPKKKQKRYYLNHGYFLVKPDFAQLRHENTSDPMPKKDNNGNYCGVWQLKDVFTGDEMVYWTYTTPGDTSKWELVHTYLQYIINRVQHLGLDVLDEDGYLPIVLKIGKLPTHMASKYVKAVSWHSENVAPEYEMGNLDHPRVAETYNIPAPKFVNEYDA